ncbi:hypothetical protein Sru01_53120 [Sphaerisporangium rufum]|uniref:Secreted protein n=1 Tax=Sphaerisporangium rufum TaxID=1381558 RepID=A0A919RAG5_9ACTN|nr:hypothetical protein [Sphaerisporangium rufum]GII80330.1 hypothetical protein Sru01_53120 [Sphaerisporangium rufum]
MFRRLISTGALLTLTMVATATPGRLGRGGCDDDWYDDWDDCDDWDDDWYF